MYNKVSDLVMWSFDQPDTVNQEWTGEDDSVHSYYMYNVWQNRYFAHFQNIQREFQVDLAELLANVARIAAASFTKALD